MKRLLLYFLFLLLPWLSSAQVTVFHEGREFMISSGTEVWIYGSFETEGDITSERIQNLGDIYLTDTLTDSGTQKIFGTSPGGTVHFMGATVQTILGGDTINFNKIELNNTGDTLTLNQSIWLKDTLTFVSGNINLNTNEVMLKTTGYIESEANDLQIFGYPGEVTLNRTFTGGILNANAGGMGMDIKLDAGTTIKVIRIHNVQYDVANGSINRYYTLKPNTQDDLYIPATVYYFDPNDLYGQTESELQIYTSETNGLTWRDKDGTVVPGSDYVSNPGTMKIGLDPFINFAMVTLAEDSCDVPPYVAILEDTIPLCSGSSAWVVADVVSSMEMIWSNGELNVDSIEVTTPGSYVITIIDEGGCYNSDTVVVVNSSDPTANFTAPTSVCIGTDVSFTNTSTVPSGGFTSSWDFGDAFASGTDTSTLDDPTYLYTQVGTHSVTLSVTSDIGCSSSKVSTVYIKPYPVADFTVPTACTDSTITFVNTTTVTPATGILYTWDFGDLSTSTSTNPTHSYGSNGSYVVELIANASGCRDTAYQTLNIYPNPVADFTFTSQCPNVAISFSNASTIASGTLSYSWDFGDGSVTSSLTNPTHTYTASGSYNVTLTTTSSQGCSNTVTKTVTVYDVPSASFTYTNACENIGLAFANTSSIASGTMSYNWVFGDGNTSTATSPSNAYTTSGNYNVQLTVTSNNGCSSSSTQSVTVYPTPNATFVAVDGCEGSTITFNNTSSISSGSMTYLWDFPTIGTSTSINESQSFSTAGLYNVELTATSSFGCVDNQINVLEIFANPTVVINGGGATCGTTSNLWVTNPGTYFWSNGSSNDSIVASFDGTYSVIVTSTDGCTGNASTSVTLNSQVAPDLGSDTIVCDSITLDAGYSGSTFLWNTTASSQTIFVTTSGQYIVSVTDQNSCVGTDTVLVTVNTSTPISLGNDQTVCDGTVITLDPGISGNTYLWSTAETTQTIDVTTTGDYSIEMTNASLCVSYDTITITFNPTPVVNFGPDNVSYCDSANLSAANSGASYTWSDASTDSTLTAFTTGWYWAIAQIGASGCSANDSVYVIINSSPVVNIGNDTILCSYQSITLDAGYPGSTYTWSEGSTSQTLSLFASGDYSVEIVDANGCSDTDSITVTVNSAFTFDLGADINLCIGADATLYSGLSSGTFSWQDYTGILGTNQNLAISDTGTYWLNATDIYGCKSSDTITVSPTNLSLYAVFLAQSEVTEGDSVTFVNLSYPRPYDSWWDFADGWQSTDSTPVHQYLDTGYYDVTLAVTNSQCTDTLTKTIHVKGNAKTTTPLVEDLTLYNEVEAVNLYPNPNTGEFSLYVKLAEIGTAEIMIFNLMGQLVDSQSKLLQEETLNYSFNNLQPGMYLLRVRVRGSIRTVKFIII